MKVYLERVFKSKQNWPKKSYGWGKKNVQKNVQMLQYIPMFLWHFVCKITKYLYVTKIFLFALRSTVRPDAGPSARQFILFEKLKSRKVEK